MPAISQARYAVRTVPFTQIVTVSRCRRGKQTVRVRTAHASHAGASVSGLGASAVLSEPAYRCPDTSDLYPSPAHVPGSYAISECPLRLLHASHLRQLSLCPLIAGVERQELAGNYGIRHMLGAVAGPWV